MPHDQPYLEAEKKIEKKRKSKHKKDIISRAEVYGRKMHLNAEEMRTEKNEFGVAQKL